jgi:hypothetical protein
MFVWRLNNYSWGFPTFCLHCLLKRQKEHFKELFSPLQIHFMLLKMKTNDLDYFITSAFWILFFELCSLLLGYFQVTFVIWLEVWKDWKQELSKISWVLMLFPGLDPCDTGCVWCRIVHGSFCAVTKLARKSAFVCFNKIFRRPLQPTMWVGW